MITGELKSKIDAVWNDFWSGGISNPLEVMEQLTYLLFIKGLDERQTLAERKANRTGKPIEDPIFPDGDFTPEGNADGPPVRGPALGSGSRTCRAKEMYDVVDDYVFPFMQARAARQHPRQAHEGRPVHDPDAGAAAEGGRRARRDPDGGPRHQGRRLRVHALEDRHRRAERPVPHAPPHHPADGRDDGPDADRHDLRPGQRHLRLPRRCRRVHPRAPPEHAHRPGAVEALPRRRCSTATTSTTRCCASAR